MQQSRQALISVFSTKMQQKDSASPKPDADYSLSMSTKRGNELAPASVNIANQHDTSPIGSLGKYQSDHNPLLLYRDNDSRAMSRSDWLHCHQYI